MVSMLAMTDVAYSMCVVMVGLVCIAAMALATLRRGRR